MHTFLDRFIYPALRNLSWRPNRELVLVLATVAIVLNGAVDVGNGEVDLATAVETAVLAVTALFVRGQSTSVASPMDNEGHALAAVGSDV